MDSKVEDRRAFERKRLNLKKRLEIIKALEVGVQDISLGGVRFRSSQEFPVGVEISVGNEIFRAFATVLECVQETGSGGEPAYLVRCRFVTSEDQAQEKMLSDLMEDAEGDAMEFLVT